MNGELVDIIFRFLLNVFIPSDNTIFVDGYDIFATWNYTFWSALEGEHNYFYDFNVQLDTLNDYIFEYFVSGLLTWVIIIILIILLFRLFKWIFTLVFKLFRA